MDTSFVILLLYIFHLLHCKKHCKKYCRIYRILLVKKLQTKSCKNYVNCCKINYSMTLESKLQLIVLCEIVIYSIFTVTPNYICSLFYSNI